MNKCAHLGNFLLVMQLYYTIVEQELVHFSLPAGPTPVTRCYSSETEDTVSTVTTVPIGGEYTSQPSENGAGVIIA